jgi:hypothetical protein
MGNYVELSEIEHEIRLFGTIPSEILIADYNFLGFKLIQLIIQAIIEKISKLIYF